MLYALLQPLMRLALRFFFKKIYFSNAKVLPWGKPFILASNHPTAFMEPLIYCSFLRSPLHSITRGDVFEKPFFRRILKSMYMIPIFRFKDGYGSLKLNHASFEHCYRTLSDQKAILIFSEGRTKLEKRLRPLQKGTARIAFGTWDANGSTAADIYIVPVGINYVSGKKFRDEVMVRFDTPIRLRDMEDKYLENPIRAVSTLTEEIKKRFEKLVIIVNNPADDQLAEQLLTIRRNEWYDGVLPIVSENNNRLEAEKRVADRINAMDDEDKFFWKQKTNFYFDKIQENNLDDFAVAQPMSVRWATWLAMAVGLLPALLGRGGNFLPAYIARTIAHRRVTEDHAEFFAPVLIATGLLLSLLYYLLLFIGACFLNNFIIWFVVLSLPLCGYYSLIYAEHWEKIKKAQQAAIVPADQWKELVALRRCISRLEK